MTYNTKLMIIIITVITIDSIRKMNIDDDNVKFEWLNDLHREFRGKFSQQNSVKNCLTNFPISFPITAAIINVFFYFFTHWFKKK